MVSHISYNGEGTYLADGVLAHMTYRAVALSYFVLHGSCRVKCPVLHLEAASSFLINNL